MKQVKGIRSSRIPQYMALKAAAKMAYELRTPQHVNGVFPNSWVTRLNRGEIGDFNHDTPGEFTFRGSGAVTTDRGGDAVACITVMYTGSDPVPQHPDDWGIEELLNSPTPVQLPIAGLAHDHVLIGLIDDVHTAQEMLRDAIEALINHERKF